ncbi:MAG: transketolase family protein [Salinispira sp.]
MNIHGLKSVAKTIRSLSADGVEAANSGHPGLPLGMAEFGAWLFAERLVHNPENSGWANRDRFVLSAGHGSMLMYSLLHLCGYQLPLKELKNFRQLHSLTPGHPEYGHTDGIETTTGPLGQGLANAVGMAMAAAHCAAVFNTERHSIINHFVYALMGDGCVMEGISTEAASLAGHVKLSKLIVFYDSNKISIEGSTNLAFSEDVGRKFDAMGWHVQHADAYSFSAMDSALNAAQAEARKTGGRPSLIILNSTIGKGAPNKEGSAGVHGSPLGDEEMRAFRKNMNIPNEPFHKLPGVDEFFAEKRREWTAREQDWNTLFDAWAADNPELYAKWQKWHADITSADLPTLPEYACGDSEATRVSSGATLQKLSAALGNLIGGSADLAPSNNTLIKAETDFSADNYGGRNLRFGVREHGMGAIVNGMILYGGLRPYAATFLVFSDYMRPAIRLAALMNLPVVYVFTHDSVFIGEDGPTHQPVEQICALRIIPNLHVLRPADAEETQEAWKHALLRRKGPVALILTRQKLEVYAKPPHWKEDFHRGAYIAFESSAARADAPSPTGAAVPAPAAASASAPAASANTIAIIATGSEVQLAITAGQAYADSQANTVVRVISMTCRKLFDAQNTAFRERLIPRGSAVFVVEAGIAMGWEGLASSRDHILSIDRFGMSAPGAMVAAELGLTSDRLLEMLKMRG